VLELKLYCQDFIQRQLFLHADSIWQCLEARLSYSVIDIERVKLAPTYKANRKFLPKGQEYFATNRADKKLFQQLYNCEYL
jgi:hypothetical protein